jgi:hypothetical protein
MNVCDYPLSFFLALFILTLGAGIWFGYQLSIRRIEWLKARLHVERMLSGWKPRGQ